MGANDAKLLLVTRNRLLRECLAAALAASQSGLKIDAIGDVDEAWQRCEQSVYTLAVFDSEEPSTFTPLLTRKFTQAFGNTAIVVFG